MTRRLSLVDVGDDAVGHQPLVLLPRLAVLGSALVLITHLAVPQQHGEVDGVEISHWRSKACSEEESGNKASSRGMVRWCMSEAWHAEVENSEAWHAEVEYCEPR